MLGDSRRPANPWLGPDAPASLRRAALDWLPAAIRQEWACQGQTLSWPIQGASFRLHLGSLQQAWTGFARPKRLPPQRVARESQVPAARLVANRGLRAGVPPHVSRARAGSSRTRARCRLPPPPSRGRQPREAATAGPVVGCCTAPSQPGAWRRQVPSGARRRERGRPQSGVPGRGAASLAERSGAPAGPVPQPLGSGPPISPGAAPEGGALGGGGPRASARWMIRIRGRAPSDADADARLRSSELDALHVDPKSAPLGCSGKCPSAPDAQWCSTWGWGRSLGPPPTPIFSHGFARAAAWLSQLPHETRLGRGYASATGCFLCSAPKVK